MPSNVTNMLRRIRRRCAELCGPVESTYASPLEPSRWRTATIVVSLLAVVELAALLAIGVTIFGKSVAHHVETAAVNKAVGVPAPAREVRPGAPKLARGDTDVLVLNGGGAAGAAGAAAGRLRGLGYLIGGVGNAKTQGAAGTIVMYRDGYRAEGARLAKDLGTKLYAPLDGMKPSELLGAQLVLVIGP
jgi:hypothetical protein